VLLGTDPPGRLRAFGSSDGGVIAQSDAGADDLRREVAQLRARISALEQDRGQLQQQSQQLGEVVRQLQELRGQLADGESRRQAEGQREQAHREEVQTGVTALQQAQAMLAGGDASVDAQLTQAQAAFPPQAQKDIAAARGALQNRDLSAARAYLSSAIAHAQQGR
jgi:chromosome segregation ATPase